jgi:hypothetical protein
MNKANISIRTWVLVAMILLAAFSRLIPHMPNFSPLGAIGLFGAAYFNEKWKAFLIPIAATWLSDLFINNLIYAQYYPTFTWFYSGFYWQYGSYLIITLVGFFLFKKVNTPRVLFGALSSTVIFFLITNFGCWIGSTLYTQDLSGLMQSYLAGIPFIKGTFLGDLFYSGALFTTFAIAQSQLPALKLSHARA